MRELKTSQVTYGKANINDKAIYYVIEAADLKLVQIFDQEDISEKDFLKVVDTIRGIV